MLNIKRGKVINDILWCETPPYPHKFIRQQMKSSTEEAIHIYMNIYIHMPELLPWLSYIITEVVNLNGILIQVIAAALAHDPNNLNDVATEVLINPDIFNNVAPNFIQYLQNPNPMYNINPALMTEYLQLTTTFNNIAPELYDHFIQIQNPRIAIEMLVNLQTVHDTSLQHLNSNLTWDRVVNNNLIGMLQFNIADTPHMARLLVNTILSTWNSIDGPLASMPSALINMHPILYLYPVVSIITSSGLRFGFDIRNLRNGPILPHYPRSTDYFVINSDWTFRIVNNRLEATPPPWIDINNSEVQEIITWFREYHSNDLNDI